MAKDGADAEAVAEVVAAESGESFHFVGEVGVVGGLELGAIALGENLVKNFLCAFGCNDVGFGEDDDVAVFAKHGGVVAGEVEI